MCLSIIFNEFQVILFAQRCNRFGHSISSVQVHNTDCLRPLGDSRLDERIIYLQRIASRLNQHGFQAVLGNTEDGGYIRVGRYDHLVTRLHHAQFNIRTPYPYQGIQTIGTTDAIRAADIVGVVLFKDFVLLALQIPSAVNHAASCLANLFAVHRRYVVQTQKRYIHIV